MVQDVFVLVEQSLQNGGQSTWLRRRTTKGADVPISYGDKIKKYNKYKKAKPFSWIVYRGSGSAGQSHTIAAQWLGAADRLQLGA